MFSQLLCNPHELQCDFWFLIARLAEGIMEEWTEKIGSDLNNHLIAIRVSQEDVIHAERLKV